MFERPGAGMTSGPAHLPRRLRLAAVLTLLALLAGFRVAPVRADALGPCPASGVELTRTASPPFWTNAVAYDSAYVNVYQARITFDRNLGRTYLWASSGGRLAAASRIVERFDVSGVDPGTPVDATLEFKLEGWSQNSCGGSGCGVVLEATLVSGSDSVSAGATQPGPGNSRRDLATTLRLPIHFVAGTPVAAQFSLRYATGPGGSAEGEITGSYGVSGLEEGVHATVCPGGDLTPARRSSWGGLKVRYR